MSQILSSYNNDKTIPEKIQKIIKFSVRNATGDIKKVKFQTLN